MAAVRQFSIMIMLLTACNDHVAAMRTKSGLTQQSNQGKNMSDNDNKHLGLAEVNESSLEANNEFDEIKELMSQNCNYTHGSTLCYLSAALPDGDDVMSSVMQVLIEDYQNATALFLDNNNLKDSGVETIAKFLGETKLEQLSLRENDIGDVGAEALADVLEESQIWNLDLNDNYIPDSAVNSIRSAMAASGERTHHRSWVLKADNREQDIPSDDTTSPECAALRPHMQEWFDMLMKVQEETQKERLEAFVTLKQHDHSQTHELGGKNATGELKLQGFENLTKRASSIAKDRVTFVKAWNLSEDLEISCINLHDQVQTLGNLSLQRKELLDKEGPLSRDEMRRIKMEFLQLEQSRLEELINRLEQIADKKKGVESSEAKLKSLPGCVGCEVGAAASIQQAYNLVEMYVSQIYNRSVELNAAMESVTLTRGGFKEAAKVIRNLPNMTPDPKDSQEEFYVETEEIAEKVEKSLGNLEFIKANAAAKADDLLLEYGTRHTHEAISENETNTIVSARDMYNAMKTWEYVRRVRSAHQEAYVLIQEFFEALLLYKKEHHTARDKFMAQLTKWDTNRHKVLAELFETLLKELQRVFKTYAKMWLRYTSTIDHLRKVSMTLPKINDLRNEVDDFVDGVHLWINANKGVSSLCEGQLYLYQSDGQEIEEIPASCVQVRELVLKSIEESMPSEDQNHLNKMCWEASDEVVMAERADDVSKRYSWALKKECEPMTLISPTKGRQYHKDHQDGAGIFY